ncbi:hypothetical protein M758_1G270700 [Ceratodon purpureus]|nr:hypothetical protein M758_1G270700 [Ceratodon purpureus]KAG0631664.1 hypothetical protein M758_1G270700 [Ceratodon purpureus]
MKMTLQATSMTVMVVGALLLCSGMVSPAEGRALLNIGKVIDYLEGFCPPPPSDAVPAPYSEPSPYAEPSPYSEPSPVDATPLSPAPAPYEPSPEYYQPPPYYASPSPVDASPTPPASYQTPPAPTGGY